ncbi:MAG: 1-acyl-sn-glycerol-3-phosphate acyltransferase [Rhodospirillales bacterium]|nr:1-acyl-sn-glycerol-3-phosphate acyltransferase [Rhodospirillales bacterium]
MILLRSILLNIWLFGISILMLFVGAAVRVVAPDKVLPAAQLWSRMLLFGLRAIGGIRVRVRGLEYLPADGPALIASRHQSAFDTMVWLTLVPRCAYVMKRELLSIPFIKYMYRPAGQIAVDRDGGAAALRGLLRDAEEAARHDRQIVIFPEGTRSDPGDPLPLQPGIAAIAARTGLAVIPAVTDSGLLWGRRSFRKYPGVIHVTLLPPIPPPGAEAGARGRLMRALAAALAQPPAG